MIIYLPKKTKILVAMARKGLNQKSLSEKAGINKATLSLFMNSKRNISPTTAKKIAAALECGLEEIFEIEIKATGIKSLN